MKKTTGVIAVLLCLALMLSACDKTADDGENTSDSGSLGSVSDTSDTEPTETEDTSEYTSENTSENTVEGTAESTAESDKITVTELSTETSPAAETEEQPSAEPINTENQVVQTAEALIGIPFAENGATPSDGFDNSGFIYYVLRENGFINCPRLTPDQAAMGTHIDYDELKSGDLAFFCTANSGNPDFGGIYIGEGRMIYSPMPGQTVKIADISSDYWKGAFVTGVSLS